MSLLKEIHEQPEHIRKVFMWLCVVITLVAIGSVWFYTTKKQVIALVYPERVADTDAHYADTTATSSYSPFATLFDSFHLVRANISDLIKGETTLFTQTDTHATISPTPVVSAVSLPVESGAPIRNK
jgi:hypothetical protein